MDLIAYRPPYRDELLHGWLKALAEENFPLDALGQQKIVDLLFAKGKLPSRRGVITKEPVRLDWIRGIDSGVRKMQADGYSVPSTAEILTYSTPLVATGISQNRGDLARYIHTAVSDMTGGPLDMPALPVTLTETRICPACMREAPYIRTWHNLPGVKACAKHGTELAILGRHTDLDNWQQSCVLKTKAPATDVDYAKYAKMIYDYPSTITCQDIRDYLASHDMKIPGIRGTNKTLPFEDTVRLLMDYRIEYIDIHFEYDDIELYHSDEIVAQKGLIGTFQCKTCGREWTDAVDTVSLGFGCPACMQTVDPDKWIDGILKQVGDGNYRLIKPFQGMGATQTVRHDTCGREQPVRLAGKIWHQTVCPCEKAHTVYSMQKLVDEISEGFTVKSYTPTKSILTLQHTDCGKSRDIPWITFRSNPTCSFCKTDTRIDSKRKRLTEKLGADYSVISISDRGTACVQHKPCGQLILGSYSSFLRGKKCMLCVPYMTAKRGGGAVTYESKLLAEMNAWFKHHPLWVSQRHREGKLDRKYSDALAVLVKKGYIYKVGYGLYSNRNDWTVYDLVKWKYLMDNAGDTVGKFTGETAAFLSGESSKEPDEITLESAWLTAKTHSTATIMGKTVRLSGVFFCLGGNHYV